ncbi:6,7-dimethyl-8-ribityllumazine synthase [Candidatus Gracilibacteria bacterium]|nr:6,7-dimethyl-8-ribityllumazine synthase [Candidatus Gracilibacteria bacterium]
MILIIASQFDKSGKNVVKSLLQSAEKKLKSLGEIYEIIRVPGAIEIPIAAQKYIRSQKPTVVLALGCVIKGETDHYEYVLNACREGLVRVSLDEGVPIIHGILACLNKEQAEARKNDGAQYADTAIAMKKLLS